MADPLLMLMQDEKSKLKTEDGNYSREELQKVWGCGQNKALRLIRLFKSEGKIVSVTREIANVHGIIRKVGAYKFVTPPKKRRKR